MKKLLVSTALVWMLWAVASAGVAAAASRARAVLVIGASANSLAEELSASVQTRAAELAIEVVAVARPDHETVPLREALEDDLALAARHDALAAVTIQVDSGGELVVVITDFRSRRTIVRRTASTLRNPAAAAEECALIVGSTLSGLLEGGEMGVVAPLATSQERKPGLAPRLSASGQAGAEWLWLRGGYEGASFSSVLPWQSSARAGFGFSFAGPFYVMLSAAVAPSSTVHSESASFGLQRSSFEFAVGYRSPTRPFAWLAELGPAAELLRMNQIEAASGFVAATNSSDWGIGGGVRAGVTWSALPRLRLLALTGVDLFPSRLDYVVRRDGAAQVVAGGALIRARASLSLEIGL